MIDDIARLVVGLLLLWAAASKVQARASFPQILAAFGVPARLRRLSLGTLVGAEVTLGGLLVAGVAVRPVALATASLGVVFTAALARARLRGARRLACGCFGVEERRTSFLIARAAAFTTLAAVAASGDALTLPVPSRDGIVLATLVALGLAVVVLTALVLALYRQVGVLMLRVGPRSALELAEEGPEVGTPAPALDGLLRRGSELVTFFSPDCRLCRELAPAVRALERDGLPVRVVYEDEDADAFARWKVPGSPFAAHVNDGLVVAKGLVNTLEQIESLLSVGAARRRHAAA